MDEVADHRHCKICGKTVSTSEKTCSAACAALRAKQLRNQQIYQLVFIGVSFLLVILFLTVAR